MRYGAVLSLCSLGAVPAAAAPPLLLQHPSLSRDMLAFNYAGEIWTVPRAGGDAKPIVVGQQQNTTPIFSPDGTRIAFTGTFDGNTAVYVVPATGGNPKRLTWYPGDDAAIGWTPDGRSVLFRSLRGSPRDLDQLYTIPADGGAASELPLPSGDQASFSPDGRHLAYTPFSQWQPAWKQYRGGQTSRIWIADLATSRIEAIPRLNSNDTNPVWAGDTIYFLSDRDGPKTLYRFNTRSHELRRVVDNPSGFDIGWAAAGPGGIVYDQFGTLHVLDTASGENHSVPVTIAAELPQTRPHLATPDRKEILNAAISPSGKRVLIEAHGEILSVPADKGEARNLTQSPGVADRDPAASPDGKSIAWFSDESGEYALHIGPASGIGPVRKIPLGKHPSYFYAPRWSPDSHLIAFHDKRLTLWIVDASGNGVPRCIDTDLFDNPRYDFNEGWSADSKWLVYSKQLPNHLHAAFVFSLDSGKARQMTDGLEDVPAARFDVNGKYIYFIGDTSQGARAAWLDLSSNGRATSSAIYAITLRKDGASPVPPENDEESADGSNKPGDKKDETKKPEPVGIDFDGLDRRIVMLPMPVRNYTGIETAESGIILATAAPVAQSDQDLLDAAGDDPQEDVSRFELKTRKTETIVEGIDNGSFHLSADGSHILFAKNSDWFVVKSSEKAKDGDGKVKLNSASLWLDPPAEWRQMYDEAWRVERDFLYDPNFQGLDLPRARKLYARFMPGIAGRQDLNVLFEEMTGNIGVGHTFIDGGTLPKGGEEDIGLLGADYQAKNGRYIFARILHGENFNPKLTAPLSVSGVNVAEGEYLLAVNGRDVTTDAEPYREFLGTAGKPTVLTVGPNADGSKSREVSVVPVSKEKDLRLRSWMQGNRQLVDKLSGGRLAYVYLPDTSVRGFANFNRYYFAQVGRQGVIVDERFNHGGKIADYFIEKLNKRVEMINATREGEETLEPAGAIFGPRVMVINEESGSGGDALPWLFRKEQLGALVGTRTWGGLVGIGGYPTLIDGGRITAPRWAIYGTAGQWEVENEGIPPDIEVVQDPEMVRQGHDPQLERAVSVALDALQRQKPMHFMRPAYPDRKPVLPDLP
jgi:tricorn protease